MKEAIKYAEHLFAHRNKCFPTKDWMRKEADVAHCIGEDYRQAGDPKVVVGIWINNAIEDNSDIWYRHPDQGWITAKEMYPDYV